MKKPPARAHRGLIGLGKGLSDKHPIAQTANPFHGNLPDPASTPAILDRLADFELQHGHAAIAERLSQRAAGLRDEIYE